jgi:outer membrane protein assembly factor BamB
MRVVRIIVGGAGNPGGPGRRRIGLWILTALALPILITAGVGYGVYHAFFRVPEFRALLFEGGRVARGVVLPLADGAVVLSQENAQPVAEVLRSGARQPDAARVYLTRVGLASSDKPRWDLALDGVTAADAGQARLWQDGERVLVASRERLEARALLTGVPVWTATLSDAIHTACRQCLAAGGGRVVVLAADGVLQAFDGATGRALWRAATRLNRPTAPDLEIAGDLVSVVDRGPDVGAVELALLRADSGAPVRRIRPACVQSSPWIDTTQALHDGDRVILALGRAGIAACFEAWDVRRGARLWQTPLPRPGTRVDESRMPWYVTSGRSLALAQASVAPNGKGMVWALALDVGQLRSLPVPEGYETRVLDARDGVLLLRATRQRGTIRDELWAMDLDKGTMLWEKPLAAGGGALPRWTARVVPAGVAFLMVLDRPNRLTYETLELRTGRPLASVTAEVEAASWEGIAWLDDAAWLTIASPYRAAFAAGTVTRVWPWQSLSNCQNIGGKVVCTR